MRVCARACVHVRAFPCVRVCVCMRAPTSLIMVDLKSSWSHTHLCVYVCAYVCAREYVCVRFSARACVRAFPCVRV